MALSIKTNADGNSGALQVNGTDVFTIDGNGNLTITGGINASSSIITQQFSGNGTTTTFTLSSAPIIQNSVEVFISGVRQVPVDNYTISGTTLTFTSAPGAGVNNIYVRWNAPILVGTTSDGSVSNKKLAFDGGAFSFRNKLINGNFDIWQRATSQTSSGYGSDDRWHNDNVGSTKTHSLQSFTVGQTAVPNNPRYFSRTIVSSVVGANNFVDKAQNIEDATLSSGKTMTLSFWARADANRNIAVEFAQVFGTGGSPSSPIFGIGATTFALTTNWQKFTTTVVFPSVAGKTLGSNNDHYFSLLFWFDAGSSFSSRTNSLGQQSGTFDIAQVQLEEGTVATPFEVRPQQVELALCQRYYQQAPSGYSGAGVVIATTTNSVITTNLPVQMRASPTITYLGSGATDGVSSLAVSSVALNTVNESWFRYQATTAASQGTAGYCVIARNVGFGISAEL